MNASYEKGMDRSHIPDGQTRQAGSLDLAQNLFWRDYTERHFQQIEITSKAQALLDMRASGQVRDLREAMRLSGSLAANQNEWSMAA